MQPAGMQRMDIERQTFSGDYFATHIIKKEGSGLVSEETPNRQDVPWKTGNVGRVVQWWNQDNSSPDAINSVFIEKLEVLVGTIFRAEDSNDMRDRLTHLVENAKAYEQFKGKIFSGAYTSPVGLVSLEGLIKKAELVLANIDKPKDSPRKDKLEKVHLGVEKVMQKIHRTEKLPEGLFRLSGVNDTVKALAEKFAKADAETIQTEVDKEDNLHNLTGGIKTAVRNLKIGEQLYPFFLSAVRQTDLKTGEVVLVQDEAEKIKLLKIAIKNLPEGERVLLKSILIHLNKIAERDKETKMGFPNLAVVWGPNLMTPPEKLPPVEIMMDTKYTNSLAELMIRKVDLLF